MDRSITGASRLLSLAQVSDLLGVSNKTVMRRIRSGQLRHHKVGRQIRISLDDYESYVARQRK